ncbi:MAG: alanine racemase, partial [Actinomycetota bacterium]|nr:alanine racemase [Actinomycetota bacterium]
MDAFRPVWAEVDLEAVRTNVRALRALVAPAALCAVVKADGYGHGAVEVSRAAMEAGADRLAVALVEEGVHLRDAGIEAPILVLSEPVPA